MGQVPQLFLMTRGSIFRIPVGILSFKPTIVWQYVPCLFWGGNSHFWRMGLVGELKLKPVYIRKKYTTIKTFFLRTKPEELFIWIWCAKPTGGLQGLEAGECDAWPGGHELKGRHGFFSSWHNLPFFSMTSQELMLRIRLILASYSMDLHGGSQLSAMSHGGCNSGPG